MNAITKFAAVATLALSVTAVAAPSQAGMVTIQSSYNGGALATLPDSVLDPNVAVFAGAIGDFNLNITSGFTGTTPLLNTSSSTQRFVGSGVRTLDVYVTGQGYIDPLSDPTKFFSGFATTGLTPGWTLTESTYISALNLLPGSVGYDGVLLSTKGFIGSAPFVSSSQDLTAFANTGAGPYALTTKYSLSAAGLGNSSSTIAISAAIPEPGTWGLMIVGFGGMGAALRNARRRQAAFA
jgi:hypothetical protein